MEDTNFHQNRRMVKRRVMEAEGGAEVRRLQIVYFLCRNGRNEHPHLIRIHHLSKNGVRLKDIKRWLGELRGKNMPQSFSWSYKRRYKEDYVWQDILDDDLVTPISDNEYFLKGSEINDSIGLSTIPMQKEQESAKNSPTSSSKKIENDLHSPSYVSSTVSSSSIEDSSPTFRSETSSSDDSRADGLENNPDGINLKPSSSPSKSLVLLKRRKTNKIKTAVPSDKSHHTKSHSSGIFRNLIICCGVDTNDSVVTMNNKQYKPLLKKCSCSSADSVRDSVKEKGEHKQQRAPRAAYRPLYGPKCSQCGKTFKPEKLHSHMNSCKGMKALAKNSDAAANISQKCTASRNEDSGSAHLLAQNC